MTENNIKTRNLIQEANAALVLTQAAFVETSSNVIFPAGVPAKVARASMANTNLLSNSGDLFVGTGNTLTEQIDGTEYTWAEVSKINRTDLFVTDFATSSVSKGLAASLGVHIDNCLHISNVLTDESNAIIMGIDAEAQGENSITIGNSSYSSHNNAITIGTGIAGTSQSSIAIGDAAEAEYQEAIAMGKSAVAKHTRGVAIGAEAEVLSSSPAITSTDGIAIGNSAVVKASSAIQLGKGTNDIAGSLKVGDIMLLNKDGKIPSSLYTNINIQTSATSKNGVAIGHKASMGQMKTGIQLGEGTMDSGVLLRVYDYNILNADGTIVRDRLPKLYKHRLGFKDSTSDGASISYVCDWYSLQSGLPTTQCDVAGNVVIVKSSVETFYWASFNFSEETLEVRYLSGSLIKDFTYDEIKESLTTQLI